MSRANQAFALIAFWLVFAAPAAAQESILSVDAIDVSYVTDDFIAAVVVHPDRILKSKALAALPLDAVVASAKERLGFDLRDVRRATILFPTPGPERDPDAVVGVVQFNKRVDGEKIVAAIMGSKSGGSRVTEHEVRGKTILTSDDGPPVGYYFPNAQTAVIAELDQFDGLLSSRGGTSALAKKLALMKPDHDLLAAIDAEPLRALLKMLSTEARGDDMMLLAIANELFAKIDACSVTVDLSKEIRIQAQIDSPDVESADVVHDLARGWLAVVKLIAPGLKGMLAHDESLPPKLADNLGKLLDAIVEDLAVQKREQIVEISWSLPEESPVLLAALAEGVQAAREAARRTQSLNNLHNLAIAVHNFADVNSESFPARANYDADGKPLLSWRVHLLPYTDNQALYDEFHLDEPWDSEHNKQLIPRMPSYYYCPMTDIGRDKTCYLAVVAENSIFPSKQLPTGDRATKGHGVTTLGSVIDGLSNTMMFVEAAPEEAVIWTKPDDWELDPENPRKGLFGMQRGFVLAAFGDASVRRVTEKASDEAIIRAVGRNDRLPYEFSEGSERREDDDEYFRRPADPPPGGIRGPARGERP